MTKVYLLESMKYTPFDSPKWLEYLKENGIEITKNKYEADLYVARHILFNSKRFLLQWPFKYKRDIPFLLWTHEPRYSTTVQNYHKRILFFPEIYIMNLYTDDVYLNNYTWYAPEGEKIPYVNATHFYSRKKCASILCTFRDKKIDLNLLINGINIDLQKLRQNIAIEGYNKNLVEICGLNWPTNIKLTRQDRLASNWHTQKIQFLRDYKFNIALENTNYKHYMSEKIWDSIAAQCLPIYYGNKYVYETFKPNSFIDAANFPNINELWKFIQNMSVNEYVERLNSCIETYNWVVDNIDKEAEGRKSVDYLINKIHFIDSKAKSSII